MYVSRLKNIELRQILGIFSRMKKVRHSRDEGVDFYILYHTYYYSGKV